MKITNLLFDLGGVIMDIRRENAVKALEDLGMADAGSFLGEYAQKGPFLMLENGSMTPAEFRDSIRKYIPHQLPDADIDRAFCRFLIGIPEHRLDSLANLRRSGFRIYMLSNTNPIMWDTVIADEFRKQGHDMDYYFDGEVTSFAARSCKPDRRIFDTAVSQFGIIPEETLFLDDSQANINAARALGFNAALVAPGSEFIDIVKEQTAG